MSDLTFGEKLMLLRKKRKVSQRALGKLLNINYSNFPKYEQNMHIPSPDILVKLADYFNVSLDYLLRDKELEEDFSNIKDRRFVKKIKDIDQLADEDRNSIINLLDGMLAKHKFSNKKEI